MTTITTAGPLRVGVDIGGTFTDVVLMGPDGLRAWTKVSSTTADYARGIIQGLESLLAPMGPGGPGPERHCPRHHRCHERYSRR